MCACRSPKTLGNMETYRPNERRGPLYFGRKYAAHDRHSQLLPTVHPGERCFFVLGARTRGEGRLNSVLVRRTRTLTIDVVVTEVEVDQAVQRCHVLLQQTAFRSPGQYSIREQARHTLGNCLSFYRGSLIFLRVIKSKIDLKLMLHIVRWQNATLTCSALHSKEII